MNSLERRRLVRGNIVDSMTKAAISKSHRQRTEAVKSLRKAMAANRNAAAPSETVSCPRTS